MTSDSQLGAETRTNLKELWRAALGELQLAMPKANYDTWFKETYVVSEEDDVFCIGVPNAFAREWLDNKYRTQVRSSLQRLVGRTVDVRFVTVPGGSPAAGSGQRPANSGYSGQNPTTSGATVTPVAPPSERRGEASSPVTAVLNPRYTFATFVVGSNNRLAHAAALSVAERPGHSYNPLFVYGGSGLGKTHLMHAIGHAVLSRHPKKRVAYATSEKFTNEFINSIRGQKSEEFRERYRRIDVLLIDDIQFIAGKEGTQEEFFHTFNAIHEEGKQIILSSDRPPKAIPQLEDRLRSRFEWGLIADISAPDLETRIAILRAKAEAANVAVPPPVIDFLAQRIVSTSSTTRAASRSRRSASSRPWRSTTACRRISSAGRRGTNRSCCPGRSRCTSCARRLRLRCCGSAKRWGVATTRPSCTAARRSSARCPRTTISVATSTRSGSCSTRSRHGRDLGGVDKAAAAVDNDRPSWTTAPLRCL